MERLLRDELTSPKTRRRYAERIRHGAISMMLVGILLASFAFAGQAQAATKCHFKLTFQAQPPVNGTIYPLRVFTHVQVTGMSCGEARHRLKQNQYLPGFACRSKAHQRKGVGTVKITAVCVRKHPYGRIAFWELFPNGTDSAEPQADSYLAGLSSTR
jgi:hypothetical protein